MVNDSVDDRGGHVVVAERGPAYVIAKDPNIGPREASRLTAMRSRMPQSATTSRLPAPCDRDYLRSDVVLLSCSFIPSCCRSSSPCSL